jgi:hypothetical protein
MIDIVVDQKTSDFELRNQLAAQLPSALTSESINIYSTERSVADIAGGYLKACRHTDRTIRYAGSPTPEKLVEAKRLGRLPAMPSRLKTGIENLSGISLDHVRVHYNSAKPATLQAHAYAQGTDIHIAPGQEKHLPHEASHVVQQAQGRVKPAP